MPPADLDLLVVGDCNPDLILSGAELEPAFGQAERLVDGAELALGGSGAIVACAAARLGLRTAIAGVLGDDVFGRFVLDALRGRGVDTGAMIVDARCRTGVTVILRRAADRAMLTFPGAITALRAEAVDRAPLARARHVHVASFFLQTALAPGLPALLAQARRGGASTSLDPNWDPSGHWDGGLRGLLGEVDLLLPNEAEAVRIAGAEDPGEAARRLAGAGPLVAVKLGAEGALAAQKDTPGVIRAGSPAVGGFLDAVGAGDAFDAGLIAALLDGLSPERALRFACACGALSTRAAGGTAAQATRDEVLTALSTGAA